MGIKGPTFIRSIDNGLGFYFKDPLKGIKHMHKGTFLRKVAKLLHELEFRVVRLRLPQRYISIYVSPLKGLSNADSTCRE